MRGLAARWRSLAFGCGLAALPWRSYATRPYFRTTNASELRTVDADAGAIRRDLPLRCPEKVTGLKQYNAFVSFREYKPLELFLRRVNAKHRRDKDRLPSCGDLVSDALTTDELYPDPDVYALCVQACANAYDAEAVRKLHDSALQKGFCAEDSSLGRALIRAYCRSTIPSVPAPTLCPTPRDVLERLTVGGGGGGNPPWTPHLRDPDFMVGENEIYKRKY